ncbi:MAG: MFS transporter [Flavobacteriaceae bacterium]|nr:MFS transporter [Flavobacteriaceae bacterium]
MFATGVLPSILFLSLLFFIAESPRFLYQMNKKEEVLIVLEKINDKFLTQEELNNMKNINIGSSYSYKMLLHPSMRKVMYVGFIMTVFIQLSGINTIIDYTPKIFSTAKWDMDARLFATFGIGLVNFLATWLSIFIIDKYGRKPMYIIGSIGMVLSLLSLSIAGFMGHFSGTLVLILILIYITFSLQLLLVQFFRYIYQKYFQTRSEV